MYPIVKERRDDGSKVVTGMRIIQSNGNVMTGNFLANEKNDESQVLHSFFLNNEEFGSDRDCYVSTSE